MKNSLKFDNELTPRKRKKLQRSIKRLQTKLDKLKKGKNKTQRKRKKRNVNKKVFVVCSSNKKPDSDFNRKINQDMLQDFFPKEQSEIDFTFCDGENYEFPSCLLIKKGKQDMIWFAGCNSIYWLFGEFSTRQLDQLDHLLHEIHDCVQDNGIVVFTELFPFNPHFRRTTEKNYSMDIRLFLQNKIIHESAMYYYNEFHKGTQVLYTLDDFFIVWDKYFTLVNEGKYSYYVKNNIGSS